MPRIQLGRLILLVIVSIISDLWKKIGRLKILDFFVNLRYYILVKWGRFRCPIFHKRIFYAYK